VDQARLQRRMRGHAPEILDDLPIDGPYPSIWMLDDRPGIWIVVGTDADGRRRVLDLGRAPSVRAGVYDHPALLRWRAGSASEYAACYSDDPVLLDRVEAAIRGAGRRSAGYVG
jgi:hypothetical protein